MENIKDDLMQGLQAALAEAAAAQMGTSNRAIAAFERLLVAGQERERVLVGKTVKN
jgi:hypothetical protein